MQGIDCSKGKVPRLQSSGVPMLKGPFNIEIGIEQKTETDMDAMMT